MSDDMPTSVFVYGTLQRGQARERCWPTRPLAVEWATIRGALYDLGPYPALVPGDDLIGGELWRLVAEDVARALAALDRVEGYAGRLDDLYRRVIIDCQTAACSEPAWTYQLARNELLATARRIEPSADGVCRWNG